MRKLIILLALILCSCAGPNDLKKYHAVCYNYGIIILDKNLYWNVGWKDENGNHVILPNDCIITEVKNER